MAFNAKPIFLFHNVFAKGTLTATDTDSDTQFDVDNLINLVVYQLWKAASVGTKYITVDLNKTLNSGFETGDLTNWAANDASASNTNPNSGTWASRMVASGSDQDGAESAKITVDPTKTYRLKSQHEVTWTAGDYKVLIHFYDSGDNLISTTTLVTHTATTGAYVEETNSIGPTGADVVFPAGTASISVQDTWDDTPTGTSDMDDVIFYEEFDGDLDPDTLGIANHNLWDSNASVSIESSDDDTEVISSWTERLAAFTPAIGDKDLILKTFTAVVTAQRAWRVKIVTANLAAFAGDIKLGARLTIPQWQEGPVGPKPRKVAGLLADNQFGQFIQRVVTGSEEVFMMTFRRLTSSFIEDTLRSAFEDFLKKGTFYASWDITNHEAHKLIGYMPDGADFNPMTEGALWSVTLRVQPMPEN